MSLTEPEIMSRMRSALVDAIEASKRLAIRSRLGQPYEMLRSNLLIIEGCCRQMAAFRGDYRWLPIGIAMAECHARAGGWLRGYTKNGIHIVLTAGHTNEAFVKLAAVLTTTLTGIDRLESQKTGALGPILPETPPEERREGRPALTRKSSLLLPAKYATAH